MLKTSNIKCKQITFCTETRGLRQITIQMTDSSDTKQLRGL